MTPKRTASNPFQCINVMTDDTVGWFPDDLSAYQYAADNDLSVSVIYRPSKRKAK